jgi:hypothetical protein
MEPSKEHKPGDLILDRYLAGADDETRERARVALREWALILISIGERLALIQSTPPAGDFAGRRHNGEAQIAKEP